MHIYKHYKKKVILYILCVYVISLLVTINNWLKKLKKILQHLKQYIYKKNQNIYFYLFVGKLIIYKHLYNTKQNKYIQQINVVIKNCFCKLKQLKINVKIVITLNILTVSSFLCVLLFNIVIIKLLFLCLSFVLMLLLTKSFKILLTK